MIAINLDTLNQFDHGTEITPAFLKEKGIIKKSAAGVKVLGRGELDKKLVIKVNAFSKSAVAKIEAAGGKAEVI
jgi:large subunit ribosomal protein L15